MKLVGLNNNSSIYKSLTALFEQIKGLELSGIDPTEIENLFTKEEACIVFIPFSSSDLLHKQWVAQLKNIAPEAIIIAIIDEQTEELNILETCLNEGADDVIDPKTTTSVSLQKTILFNKNRKDREQQLLAAQKNIAWNTKRLSLLNDISIYQSKSEQDYLDYALNKAIELTESQFGYIYFYDEESKLFTLNSWSNDVMDNCEIVEPNTCYELDKTGYWGEAVRQRKPLILNDFKARNPLKKGYPAGHAELHRFLTTPIYDHDKIIAVVGMANKKEPYTDDDVKQLQFMMNTVWNTLYNRKTELENLEFANALEHSPVSIVITDINGNIELVNKYFEKRTGYSFNEVKGKNPRVLKSGTQAKEFYQNLWSTITSGKTWVGELQNKAKDGSIFWESATISPIKNPNGVITKFIAVKKDITEKRAQDEMLVSQKRLLEAVESISNSGGWEYDVKNKKVTWTKTLYDLHGFDHNDKTIDLITESLNCYYESDQPELKDVFARAIEQGTSFEGTFRFTNAKGDKLWVSHKCESIKDQNGVVTTAYGSIRDVTNEINSKNALSKQEEKLKTDERIRNSVFDVLSEGLVVQDQNDQIVLANEAACKTLSLTMDQLTGKSSFDPIWKATTEHDEDLKPELHPSSVTLRTGKPVKNFIMKVNTGSDQRKTIIVNSNPILNEKGDVLQSVTSFFDITETQIAHEKVIEAETRLHYALAATKAGTWDWNIEADDIIVNNRWAELLGYDLVELGPLNKAKWEQLCHPEDLKNAISILELNISGKLDYYDCEVRMKHKRGHWVWIWTRGQIFSRDQNSKAQRMVGTHIDITVWKQSENALKESEEKYKFLNESLEELIWSAQPDGRIDYVNQFTIKKLGVSFEYLSNNGWLQLVHLDDKDEVVKKWNYSVANSTRYFNEQRLRVKDGSYHWFKVTGTPRKDARGKVTKWIGLSIDINSEKEAELALNRSSNNLALLANFANDFIHFTDKQSIYAYLAEQVQAMVGKDSIVIVSEVIKDGTQFQIKKIHGIENKTRQVLKFIGQPIEGLIGNINPDTHATLNGESLTELPLNMTAMTDGKFASMINDGIFKLLGITSIKSIKINQADKEIGILALILRKDNLQINNELIKAVLKQASLALVRAKNIDAILTSEKALKEAQAIAKLGSYTYHADSSLYELSEQAKKIANIESEAEVSQIQLLRLVHPDDRALAIDKHKETIEGWVTECEFRIIVNDQIKWLNQVAKPTRKSDGELSGVKATVLDVTSKKQIELNLEQNEIRFKNLIENNANLIAVENKDFKLTYVSPSAHHMLGYTQEELLNQSTKFIIHTDDRAKRDLALEPLLNNLKKVVTIKLRLKKKSGSYIWTEVTYSNRLNIKGIDGYILNIIDIDNDEKSANELKAVNERFKLAESATKNIIWDYYTERQEYVINTSFKTLFGVDDPLISAEKWTELIHEDDRSRVQESFDKLASNREQNLWLIDYRLRKPDGNYLWTSSKATTLRNAQGEVIRVIGSMTDVTERVLYEKSIQQQNDKLKDIAWMQSHLVRAPLANLLGLLELLKDCSSEEREQMEGLIFESATKLDSIIKNIVKNAERLGEKQYLVDDSSMQSNKDLIPSIHLHPQLLEMAPRAYIICNKTKRIVFVNKAFEELSGYPMEELLSKKYIDHLFPNNTNKETQEYTLLKEKQRESYEVELLLKSKNETNIWVRVNGQPFISEEGVHQGYFFSLKNIEAEKETQKTILEKTENLTHINEELKHFTYTISHDLKEPINGLSGLLSLLKAETDDQSSEDAKQYLSLAAKSVDRISAMVKSLLEYSKSGSDTEAAKTVSLQSVIDEIKLGLRLQIEKNNAQVILHGEDQFISVHPIQFSRVLQNLINNSIKFKSEKDPIINIYLKELEKHWEISVEDNGKGIHKGDINHVFDLFYFNNKDKNESHGIGLAVVKKLVERHQGEISVKSEVGKGTTFCFTISKELFH